MAGVYPAMNMRKNPELRRLIEEGVIKLGPLRPRNLADLPRIRAALKLS